MASTSEVGHNKNAANFNTLAQILQEMGTLYNPTNPDIKRTNLEPVQTAIANAINTLNAKKPLYTNAVANREIATTLLGKTTSKILNSFKSLNVSATDKENLTSMVKKIRGDKKRTKVNPDTTESSSISTSQMSYDSRIANLDALIGFINTHPEYNPNEEDIKITALETYNEQLKTLTQTVNAAGNALITARKHRNNILYKNSNNILDMAKEIKAYLKSLGDDGKPYYQAAIRLKFVKVK
jgi:hypothetical protein